MPEKEVVNNPGALMIMLEFALGLLTALYGVLVWRVVKSVPKADLDKAIKDMEDRFDKRVDDLKDDLTDDTKTLKKDLKAQITEYKNDAAEDIKEVKGICDKIYDVIEKRNGGK